MGNNRVQAAHEGPPESPPSHETFLGMGLLYISKQAGVHT